MSTILTEAFDNPANYSFDNSLIEMSGGKAKIKLQQAINTYSEDFADDTGFTYDNTKAEFTGGVVRQKDLTPANSAIGSTFTSSKNPSWVNGATATLTEVGTTTISGGRLAALDFGNNGIYYTLSSGVNGTGALKFKYTPNYSNKPGNNAAFFQLRNASGNSNIIAMYHSGVDGIIKLTAYDNSGTQIHANVSIGSAWNPTSGTTYEMELNWSTGSGVLSLYINGVLLGSAPTTIYTRGNTSILAIGANTWTSNVNAYFDDVVLFTFIKHTANYTPGYTLPETIYAETVVTLPEVEHVNPGTFLSFDSLTTTEVGSPKYLIEIGRSGEKLYYNSAWIDSNDTYAQSSPVSDFNTYKASIPVSGEIYGQFSIVFPASNTLSSVANLEVSLLENTTYPISNPAITTLSTFYATELEDIQDVVNIVGDDLIKFVLLKNNIPYYWDGADVVVSNGTYAQSNTIEEIQTNKADFITMRQLTGIKIFLHSEDGSTSPEISELEFTYNSALTDPIIPTLVNLEGFIYDANGPVANQEIKVRPFQKGFFNNGIFHRYAWESLGFTDTDGFFSVYIYKQSAGNFWELKIGSQAYKIELEDTDEMDAKDCPTWETIFSE